VLIPADAAVFDQNGLHVAVVENGTAYLQKITIARDFGTEVDPSAITARTVQDLTVSPSISTVQAPHCDVLQPTCVPVKPRSSRSI
jgi:hypothetical protein